MNVSYDIPAGWSFPRLDGLASTSKGSIRIGPFGSALKKHEYGSTDIRVLGIEDVYPNELISTSPKFIPESKYSELMQYTVSQGDILVTNMGTVGRACIVPEGLQTSIISSHLIKVSVDQKIVLPAYLCRALNNFSIVKAQIEAKCHGAIMAGFNSTLLKSLLIPLPPLKEQKRIIAILDKADAIRRKRQQAIDLADDFLRSVFLDMFGDPILNSKSWNVMPLGMVAEFENGDRSNKYPSGDDIKNEGVLFLSTKNISGGQLDLGFQHFITQEKFDDLGRGKARADDLLITLRGTLGSCCIFDCEYQTAFINAQMMIIRPTAKTFGTYLHAFINSKPIQAKLQYWGHGGAVPQLTAKQLGQLDIPVPPEPLQEKFQSIVKSKRKLSSFFDEWRDNKLFESLSQRAFRGEL